MCKYVNYRSRRAAFENLTMSLHEVFICSLILKQHERRLLRDMNRNFSSLCSVILVTI
jgi:hypothetical protein